MGITMNNVPLEQVSVYKYLGVHIDSALNFKMHIKGVIKNVSHKVHMLGKIRPKLSEKAAIMVFKGMILPLFDNGDSMTVPTSHFWIGSEYSKTGHLGSYLGFVPKKVRNGQLTKSTSCH